MNQTSAEEMAKVFFDMILVKHLEVLRIKDKLA